MIRIIGGKFRHRILAQPPLNITRPSKDSLKEGIFNAINSEIQNRSFLDLFAGSGAVGIEAYSRGAKNVVLVDDNIEAIKVIKHNLETLNIEDITILFINFNQALKILEEKNKSFDFIFLDPPYKMIINKEFILNLKKYNIFKDNSVLIVEVDYELDSELLMDYKYKIYTYGKTSVYILRRKI